MALRLAGHPQYVALIIMPAKDFYHDSVRVALEKDGWEITHDPYTLTFGATDLFVDLGAELPIAAEKGNQKIAVEVKSFLGPSGLTDLQKAVGQYAFYASLMESVDANRVLHLAVPREAYDKTLSTAVARPVLERLSVPILVFDPTTEGITKWIEY